MKIAMMTNNYKPFVGGVPISVERQVHEKWNGNSQCAGF